MLRLFKGFRQDLLPKNKILGYLAYALGEIVLVVVGILIAVKIGDISEQRKQAEEFQVALHEVESSLIAEIRQAEGLYSHYALKDSLCDIVLAGKSTKEMYSFDNSNTSHLNLTYLLSGWAGYSVFNNGFLEMQKNIKHAPKKYDMLIKRLTMFDSGVPVLASSTTSDIIKIFPAVQKEWANKYAWAANIDDPVNNPAYLDYLLNSWEYKNLVSIYKKPGRTMIILTNELSMQAAQNLALLRTLNGTSQEAIVREMVTLLKPDTISVKKCPSEMPTFDDRPRGMRQFIFLNRRAETVRIYHDFTNGKLDNRFDVVEPNQSITLRSAPSVSSIFRNEKGECLGSYTAGTENGIIIIE